MHFSTIGAPLLALVGTAAAAGAVERTVTITKSVVSGTTTTNSTTTFNLGAVYSDSAFLGSVSTLYLTSASADDVNSIVCTPYGDSNGQTQKGSNFTVNSPAFLSTNVVQVGSVACNLDTSSKPKVSITKTVNSGNSASNTSVTFDLETVYDDSTFLGSVSTLYVTGSIDADLNSITCTPYSDGAAQNQKGNAFTANSPSQLSTNVVQVGSIYCAVSSGSSSSSTATSTTMATSATSAAAATTTASTVTIAKSVSGEDRNDTATFAVGAVYSNSTFLGSVSMLYLTGVRGDQASAITCTPYGDAAAQTQKGGNFTVNSPAFLSTNVVQVGSVVCRSNSTTGTGTGAPTGTGSATGSASSVVTAGVADMRVPFVETAMLVAAAGLLFAL